MGCGAAAGGARPPLQPEGRGPFCLFPYRHAPNRFTRFRTSPCTAVLPAQRTSPDPLSPCQPPSCTVLYFQERKRTPPKGQGQRSGSGQPRVCARRLRNDGLNGVAYFQWHRIHCLGCLHCFMGDSRLSHTAPAAHLCRMSSCGRRCRSHRSCRHELPDHEIRHFLPHCTSGGSMNWMEGADHGSCSAE